MNSFLDQLIPSLRAAMHEELIREIARRSVADVHARLRPETSNMSVAQLRGYVRARAAQPVARHARLVASEAGLRKLPTTDVVSRALERTVHAIVRELIATPPAQVGFRLAG